MVFITIPNLLSVTRILLSIPIIICLYSVHLYVAFFLFSVAAVTDWLDGFMARQTNQISYVGQILDPLADKILMTAVFLSLWQLSVLPTIVVVPTILRDLLIIFGGLYLKYTKSNVDMRPTLLSKINTFLQLILVIVAFLILIFGKFHYVIPFFCYIILVTVSLSSIQYTLRFLMIFRQ
ncbi:MAG: CDP-alcohol phosphatidyltransferase family protein [Proteobacteria bacterium]|nr:CDP-alcohol phosphatidyltransferase family protein [Pseudomonadota bacterium]